MNEDIKKTWVEALRSGNFSQTYGTLRNDSGFCCLGVLCEIAKKDEVVASRADVVGSTSTEYFNPEDLHDAETSVPPQAVVKWSGLEDSNPTILISEEEKYDLISRGVDEDAFFYSGYRESWATSLATVNDRGLDFSGVADLIEQKL